MDYLLHLGVLCALYVVAAWSLDLLVGRLGIFSLAHGAFIGAGAYSYAIARTRFGASDFTAIGLALVTSTCLGALVAKPVGRLKGEQAMLLTLAIQGMTTTLLFNLTSVTGGSFGIAGIRSPFGFSGRVGTQFALAASILAINLGFFILVHRSAFGLAMKAVGEDELLAGSARVCSTRVRVMGFAIAGGTAGLAGTLFASYLSFIDPSSFDLNESIFLVTALLVGGTGNLRGPAAGVILIVILPELLRAVAVPPAIAGNLQKVLFAIALILTMRFKSLGLAGEAALR